MNFIQILLKIIKYYLFGLLVYKIIKLVTKEYELCLEISVNLFILSINMIILKFF